MPRLVAQPVGNVRSLLCSIQMNFICVKPNYYTRCTGEENSFRMKPLAEAGSDWAAFCFDWLG